MYVKTNITDYTPLAVVSNAQWIQSVLRTLKDKDNENFTEERRKNCAEIVTMLEKYEADWSVEKGTLDEQNDIDETFLSRCAHYGLISGAHPNDLKDR